MPDNWSPLDSADGGRPPWFGRKRLGWGWSPRTWQGYLLTSVLLVVIVAITAGTRSGWVPYLAAAVPLALWAITAAARRRR
jgi:hypothetical protein